MKIFFFIAGFLCVAYSAFAQHTIQLDDGTGNYLLLLPPPGILGSPALTLPVPPVIPMTSGFLCEGTINGQIPVWSNAEMMWAPMNPGIDNQILTITGGIPVWAYINANQLPNLQNLNGLLDIGHGGTGQITANAALNALLPTQTGNTTKFLQTDGSNTSWVTVAGGSAVTSVFGRTGIVVAATNDYSFSQLSGSAIASQLPNLQNMNGLLDIGHGGTGQTTANAALNALLPTQTGNSTKFLQTDGSNTSWVTVAGGSAVTSVFGRTGIVVAANNDYSFSQLSGVAIASQLPNLQNMNGLLDIGHGGTGQTTANAALNALLPTQTGNTTKFLQTDGTNTSWVSQTAAPVTSVFGRTGIVVAATNDYSFSQLSGAAIASQLPNVQNMNGLLDIGHGGTGQITANAALNALLPTQTGNTTKFLQTDGTNTSWVSQASSPVTSVFGRTGIVVAATNDYSFSQLSGAAIASQLPNLQNMNGLLDIGHGGTGQTTANAALNALLPTQTGNTTKFLQTDGSNTSWVSQTAAPVTSVFGRTGIVVAATNDYSFSQLSGAAIASQLPNLQNMNGLLDIGHGGTGISSYTLGDMLYASAGTTLTIFSGNTSATRKFLTQQGTGSASAAPAWNIIAATDMPVMIASGASHASGAVPDPGATSGTTKFLREDGTWQVPAGGGGGTGVNYDVTTAQNTSTTSTDYLFNVAYSGSAGAANAAGALINSTATGASNSGIGLTITADGGNSSLDKGIVINTGDNTSTNLSSTGIVVTATATGTGTSKGLDITCSGGANRVGLLLTDGHLQSKQTTVVTAAKQAKAGATATNPTTTGCTDIAGKITMTVQGAGLGAGDQVKISFNKAFATAPIVMVCAGSQATVLASPYISAITINDFTIALGNLPSSGDAEVYYYHVIETQ